MLRSAKLQLPQMDRPYWSKQFRARSITLNLDDEAKAGALSSQSKRAACLRSVICSERTLAWDRADSKSHHSRWPESCTLHGKCSVRESGPRLSPDLPDDDAVADPFVTATLVACLQTNCAARRASPLFGSPAGVQLKFSFIHIDALDAAPFSLVPQIGAWPCR